MVAAGQDVGDARVAEFGRPRVVRVLEQSAGGRAVRLVDRRGLVAEYAGQEARTRVDDRHRRDLATGHDEVTERHLFIDVFPHALVEPLVTSADEHDGVAIRELLHSRLIEYAPLWRQEDAVRAHVARGVGVERLHRRDEDIDAHDHPAAATVRGVVDAPVLAQSEVARAPETHGELAAVDGAPDEARREVAGEHLRKKRDDIDPHGRFPLTPARRRRASRA